MDEAPARRVSDWSLLCLMGACVPRRLCFRDGVDAALLPLVMLANA